MLFAIVGTATGKQAVATLCSYYARHVRRGKSMEIVEEDGMAISISPMKKVSPSDGKTVGAAR